MALNINFIIFLDKDIEKNKNTFLEKSSLIRKSKPKQPFILIAPHCCEDYVILYSEKRKENSYNNINNKYANNQCINIFNLIVFNLQFLFNLNEFPLIMRRTIEKYDSINKEEIYLLENEQLDNEENFNRNLNSSIKKNKKRKRVKIRLSPLKVSNNTNTKNNTNKKYKT
jgi:hypothetical protein